MSSLAVVGTGLVGTSVARAASGQAWRPSSAGTRTRHGWRCPGSSAPARSPTCELVVVAVPVGSAVDAVRAALAAAPAGGDRDRVGSTKRALAERSTTTRFVPGHPVAGGETSGPDRAAAELFDGATWFLTPRAVNDAARVERVERFVTALGARPVRRDAAEHDRLLALTSHLPHALANALVRVAAGEDGALEAAGASLREMTRVAGANSAVWTDIFLENGDLIAHAVAALRSELESRRARTRRRRPAYLERSIAAAHDGRNELLSHAYQTEAGAAAPDSRPRSRQARRARADHADPRRRLGINIEDFELRHVSPEYGGVLVMLVAGGETASSRGRCSVARATRPLSTRTRRRSRPSASSSPASGTRRPRTRRAASRPWATTRTSARPPRPTTCPGFRSSAYR